MKAAAKRSDDRETVERLLDTAERLFGEYGYDGVGMRALAQEARVNLGATTYHFGSKKALYIETFLRRFRSNNVERLRLLREAETDAQARGRPLSVESIVDCLMRPAYLMGLANPAFHALLARSLFMPPPFLHGVLHRELEPNMAVFRAALRRSLPAVAEDVTGLRLGLAMGSLLTFLMQMGKVRSGSNPKIEAAVFAELVRFVSAGLASEPATRAADRPVFASPRGK